MKTCKTEKADNRLFDNLSGMQHDNLAGYYLIHGESHDKITRELEAIYNNNIRAVVFESRYHPDYCGEKYFEDVRFMFEECRRLGMRAWLMDDNNCPSGNCNKMLEDEEYFKYRPWQVREFHLDVPGPVTEGSVMADQWLADETESFLSILAVKHVPDSPLLSNEIVDITENVRDGMVYFNLGEGVWRIFFLIKTQKSSAPLIDKLRPECTDFYIEQVHQKIYDNLSEYFGNTFLGFFNDEAGFHNNGKMQYVTGMGVEGAEYPWGDCVLEMLRATYGDKAFFKLLGLWYKFEDGSEEKARVEYMDTITLAFYNNYSKKIAAFCHEHGIKLIGHFLEDGNGHAKTGHGCGHFFRAVGDQDMSGIDTVLQQHIPGMTQCSNKAMTSFKHHDNVFYNYYLAKLGASYAHIDSRKNGRLMLELFGAYGHNEGTKMMKYIASHMLVRGVNYFLPCLYSTDESIFNHFPPIFYCGGKNALYPYYTSIMDYMNRSAHLLTDGVHVPSCAIFYDAHGHWANGDFLPAQDLAKVLYDNLYDYDILPVEYVEKIDENGILNGEKYPILLLPYSSYLPQDVVMSLKNANIRVVCVSDKGRKSPDFETIDLKDVPSFMKNNGFGDVKADYEGIYLRPYHYTRGTTHFYMLVNEDIANTISTDITLKDFDGGDYAIYDPMKNKAWRAFSSDGTIHLDLASYESVFVICGELDYDRLPYLPKLSLAEEIDVKVTYSISLGQEGTEYVPYAVTDKLFNVTGYEHKARFSGNMLYEATVKFEKADRVILDLGYVGEAVEVKLDGVSVEKLPAPPYLFDITDFVRDGENRLEIIVTNHLGYNRRDRYSSHLLFEPSGLLGPVKLRYYKKESGN